MTSLTLPRLTQPPTVRGTGNESDQSALMHSAEQDGSFHSWVAGKTVTALTRAILSPVELSFIVKLYTNLLLYLVLPILNQQCHTAEPQSSD